MSAYSEEEKQYLLANSSKTRKQFALDLEKDLGIRRTPNAIQKWLYKRGVQKFEHKATREAKQVAGAVTTHRCL